MVENWTPLLKDRLTGTSLNLMLWEFNWENIVHTPKENWKLRHEIVLKKYGNFHYWCWLFAVIQPLFMLTSQKQWLEKMTNLKSPNIVKCSLEKYQSCCDPLTASWVVWQIVTWQNLMSVLLTLEATSLLMDLKKCWLPKRKWLQIQYMYSPRRIQNIHLPRRLDHAWSILQDQQAPCGCPC